MGHTKSLCKNRYGQRRRLLCEFSQKFANLLYKIELDDKDKTLLYKSLKKNKEFLTSTDIKKKEFKIDILDTVSAALEYKYNN